jgi:hypothetical protein
MYWSHVAWQYTRLHGLFLGEAKLLPVTSERQRCSIALGLKHLANNSTAT